MLRYRRSFRKAPARKEIRNINSNLLATMVSIIHFDEDNLAGFHVQHYIDESGLRMIVHEMEEKASLHDKVHLYFEFVSFGDWDSVQSFFDTLKLMFHSWNKIARYAIVTDKDWVKKQSRLANFLTPHFEVKAFSLADREQALAWLRQPVPGKPEQGVSVLEAMPQHVVGLATLGGLSSSDYSTINHLVEEQHSPDLRLYLEVLQPNGAAPDAMCEDLKHGVQYYEKFSKVAIAGHEEWLQRSGAYAPGGNVRFFKLDERDTAIDWLR
ncbi:STAS/SEC14 domain-containing protein [Pontibacter anaerobius]|uniref:STAS/SEC14 domain-containing protein n=1 Tax=Pontibacter anaerobius TaxID=2993940 RepID=A0ABT3RJ28_9BACT|nr:STAS/SEC14 domain-containing protein [Pontibacter anaerobius]MCX2741373.1 STAS/SEC14 domain-containing protein [Pontibacter anaerobius]